ncbi:PREDICTED: putative B3 domain-containing [Prunus dulcis]|uniref:PREDICTED: putative B3 domain-containing n=1 Tax=Prunus dulcis TaxID=3755 RepID=A0A5E4E6T7_PRUDU|nr:PREDICTED: putative B3 domain-containing [Prunus dulcis]
MADDHNEGPSDEFPAVISYIKRMLLDYESSNDELEGNNEPEENAQEALQMLEEFLLDQEVQEESVPDQQMQETEVEVIAPEEQPQQVAQFSFNPVSPHLLPVQSPRDVIQFQEREQLEQGSSSGINNYVPSCTSSIASLQGMAAQSQQPGQTSLYVPGSLPSLQQFGQFQEHAAQHHQEAIAAAQGMAAQSQQLEQNSSYRGYVSFGLPPVPSLQHSTQFQEHAAQEAIAALQVEQGSFYGSYTPPVPRSLQNLIGRCSEPFEKQLSGTDVALGSTSLTISKEDVKRHILPLLKANEVPEEGIQVTVYDIAGEEYPMLFKRRRYRYFLLGPKWRRLYQRHGLEGDQHSLTFWAFRKVRPESLCFVITWRRLPAR